MGKSIHKRNIMNPTELWTGIACIVCTHMPNILHIYLYEWDNHINTLNSRCLSSHVTLESSQVEYWATIIKEILELCVADSYLLICSFYEVMTWLLTGACIVFLCLWMCFRYSTSEFCCCCCCLIPSQPTKKFSVHSENSVQYMTGSQMYPVYCNVKKD